MISKVQRIESPMRDEEGVFGGRRDDFELWRKSKVSHAGLQARVAMLLRESNRAQ